MDRCVIDETHTLDLGHPSVALGLARFAYEVNQHEVDIDSLPATDRGEVFRYLSFSEWERSPNGTFQLAIEPFYRMGAEILSRADTIFRYDRDTLEESFATGKYDSLGTVTGLRNYIFDPNGLAMLDEKEGLSYADFNALQAEVTKKSSPCRQLLSYVTPDTWWEQIMQEEDVSVATVAALIQDLVSELKMRQYLKDNTVDLSPLTEALQRD